MRKRIILHGHLAEKHPDPIEVEADTIAEALEALVQYPELAHPPGEPWPVRIKGVESREDLYSVTPVEEIHVYPRTGGGGGGRGVLQTLLGVVLIAISIFQPMALAALQLNYGTMFLTGALMLTGGLLQMLMPMPETDESASKSSSILRGASNTTKIGTPIPLAYGNQPLYGHYLSFDVDAKEWSEDNTEFDKLVSDLPGKSTTVGVHPVPGGSNSSGGTQGVYVEYDRPLVPYTLVNPVFQFQDTGPSNIPTSGWVV